MLEEDQNNQDAQTEEPQNDDLFQGDEFEEFTKGA